MKPTPEDEKRAKKLKAGVTYCTECLGELPLHEFGCIETHAVTIYLRAEVASLREQLAQAQKERDEAREIADTVTRLEASAKERAEQAEDRVRQLREALLDSKAYFEGILSGCGPDSEDSSTKHWADHDLARTALHHIDEALLAETEETK